MHSHFYIKNLSYVQIGIIITIILYFNKNWDRERHRKINKIKFKLNKITMFLECRGDQTVSFFKKKLDWDLLNIHLNHIPNHHNSHHLIVSKLDRLYNVIYLWTKEKKKTKHKTRNKLKSLKKNDKKWETSKNTAKQYENNGSKP